jgi:hypothetical protein
MATDPTTATATMDDIYYVSAADLADKLIVLMQQGCDPLLLNTSMWALVQTSQSEPLD